MVSPVKLLENEINEEFIDLKEIHKEALYGNRRLLKVELCQYGQNNRFWSGRLTC